MRSIFIRLMDKSIKYKVRRYDMRDTHTISIRPIDLINTNFIYTRRKYYKEDTILNRNRSNRYPELIEDMRIDHYNKIQYMKPIIRKQPRW